MWVGSRSRSGESMVLHWRLQMPAQVCNAGAASHHRPSSGRSWGKVVGGVEKFEGVALGVRVGGQ